MEKSLENSKSYWEVYNLGISGDNSDNILIRLENEINCRIWRDEEIMIIFSVGINDSQVGKIGISSEKFKKNIDKLINTSSKFSSKIVFIGLTPVDESKTSPIPWDIDEFYKSEYILKYDNIIKSICKENKVYFIDMFDEFKKINYKKLLEDGLHPNFEGHQKMFEIVRDFLVKEGIMK
jgi:lysophospholipase L1-like esterase